MKYEAQLIERALKQSRAVVRRADCKKAAEHILTELELDYELVPKRSGGHRTWEMSDG